jgi:hypothetical protein
VERLGNVGGRELDNHALLSGAGVAGVLEAVVRVLSVGIRAVSDRGQQQAGELVGLEEEGNKRTASSRLLDQGRLGELRIIESVNR